MTERLIIFVLIIIVVILEIVDEVIKRFISFCKR